MCALEIPGYQMLAPIGKGGMGVVYKAKQLSLDRLVAIKVMSTGVTEDPTFVARFMQEAKLAAGLRHEHIISIIDFGEIPAEPTNIPYIVMEYVEGQTLDKILVGRRTLELDTCVRLMDDVASAMDYAHKKPIVHRDIKPANVMIRPDGAAMIMD